jgi:hypothetical protein
VANGERPPLEMALGEKVLFLAFPKLNFDEKKNLYDL